MVRRAWCQRSIGNGPTGRSAVATDDPAVALGNHIWMSPGVSNSYAVATDDGRVIVNGGLFFEGP